MGHFLSAAYSFVWGIPALVMILGVGTFLTVRTGCVQLMLFPRAVAVFFRKLSSGEPETGMSSFRALCTALGATVGTGNIIGVAGAVCLGGPGAVFWMWLSGFLGMATKYAEVTLAVRFRMQRCGEYSGGPMYVISRGMGTRWRSLAVCYCVCGIAASFGIGNATQINAVVSGIRDSVGRWGGALNPAQSLAIGLILSVLIGSVLLGGAGRIGMAAEILVPVASVAYILLCLLVLLNRADRVDDAFAAIFSGAFSPGAVTGGMLGSAFSALRTGCSRGVFTNEAGMGTAAIAHACAAASHPAEQGLLGIVEVFLDTVVLCTLTALVILTSGIVIPYGTDAGGTLTSAAFSAVCGSWTSPVLTVFLICFAVATVLGWGLYGSQCVRFLLGEGAVKYYNTVQILAVIAGAVLRTDTVWLFSELLNGLMAIPNLISLAVCSPELIRLTKEYKNKAGSYAAEGGNHADFHQCKPL